MVNVSIGAERELNRLSRLSDLVIYGDYFNISFVEDLSQIDNVVNASGLLTFSTNLEHKGKSYPVNLYGITRDPAVDTIPNFNWDEFNGYKVVIDPGSSSVMNITEGTKIHLLNQTFEVYEVRRIPWFTDLEYSGIGSVAMPYDTLSKILNITDMFNEVHVKIANNSLLLEISKDIYDVAERYGYHVSIKPRYPIMELIMSSFVPLFEQIKYVIIGLLIFSMTIYIYVDIREARREIGLYELVGMTFRGIILMYFFQVFIIITFSVLLAIPFGLGLSYLLARRSEKILDIELDVTGFLRVPYLDILFVVVVVYVLSVLMAYILVSKLKIVSVIRGETEYRATRVGHKSRHVNMGIKRKIFLRSISARRIKVISLILLTAMIIAATEAPKNVIKVGAESYFQMVENEMLWDEMVVLYDLGGMNKTRQFLNNSKYVKYYEEVVHSIIPVLYVKSSKTKIKPPKSYIDLFALNGNEKLIKFKFCSGELKPYGMVISKKLSEILDIDVGDTITITSYHALGFKYNLRFEVVGIVDTSFAGGFVIIIHSSYLMYMAGDNRSINNTFLVELKPNVEPNEALSNISNFIAKNRINGIVMSKHAMIEKANQLKSKLYAWILPSLTAIQVLMMLSVIFAVKKDLVSRSREISILYAMGITERELTTQYSIIYLSIFLVATPLSIIMTKIVTHFMIAEINISLSPLWMATKVPFEAYIESVLYNLILSIIIIPITYTHIVRLDHKEMLSAPE